jgi:hypothetical protein
VPCESLPGSGSSPVAVSATLAKLAADTTYHYRIVAANAGGTRDGSDQTLQTPPDPPTVETLAATSVTAKGAKLNASVNPNSAVTSCRFEYGTLDSLGSTAPCSPSPGSGASPIAVVGTLKNLSPGTSYDFRVVASSAGGTSFGAELSFTTAGKAASFGRRLSARLSHAVLAVLQAG